MKQLVKKRNIRLAKELIADSNEDFKKCLDEIDNTMKERGLTEDILKEILKEDQLAYN